MGAPDAEGNWLFPRMTSLAIWNLEPSTSAPALKETIDARHHSFLPPLEYLSLGGDPGTELPEEQGLLRCQAISTGCIRAFPWLEEVENSPSRRRQLSKKATFRDVVRAIAFGE